jgi:Uma2 family endonuclease
MAIRDQVPPLCAGDRLSRDEFERRYAAMPGLKTAELVEGVVYMPSPVRHVHHGHPHSLLTGWLLHYCAATPGLECSTSATLRLDQDNVLQPDQLLRIAGTGGNSRVDGDGYLTGAPELIVEVAASTTSYDLHQKLEVYRRAGVPEYLVMRTADRQVDWFVLRAGSYRPLAPDAHGTLRSERFPGLWLPVPALLAGDAAAVLAAVAAGTGSPEHAALRALLRQ